MQSSHQKVLHLPSVEPTELDFTSNSPLNGGPICTLHNTLLSNCISVNAALWWCKILYLVWMEPTLLVTQPTTFYQQLSTIHGGGAMLHKYCVLLHNDTCRSDCCPHNLRRQQSSLAQLFSLLPTFALLEQSTSLLSCLVGKNSRRVILFEWVILFKKPTVNVFIGNYIRRVRITILPTLWYYYICFQWNQGLANY